MGYTFAAALVKKTGAPGKKPAAPTTRKAIREGMEALGYVKAVSAEDAPLRLPLYHDKKSAWLTIALEIPENLGEQLELLRKLAAEMHTPILYFINFDSDFLYVAATDGKAVQHVHIGWIDEDGDEENAEAMQDSEDLSIFDALLPDDAARAEFRRILAVDMMERIFSESAAQEMAALFGYTPEGLFIDEDAEPYAVLGFDLPSVEAVPFLMPEDAPPAFTKSMAMMGWGNPAELDVTSCGGTGRGIRVLLKAVDYDPNDWELTGLTLSNEHVMRMTGKPADMPYNKQVVPQRVKFQDGGEGWMAEFPDVPIYRGVNPKSPMANSEKAYHYHKGQKCSLTIAFRGGTFKAEQLEDPDIRTMMNPAAMAAYHQKTSDFYRHAEDGKTLVWIVPMENPAGAINHAIPRQPIRCAPYRPADNDSESE